MAVSGPLVSLERISPELATRIVARSELAGDGWHPEYPFQDELDPLRTLALDENPDAIFTLYLIRRDADGLAVGGIGFFGPPDAAGRVELGYGLVSSARGQGLASAAVDLAMQLARRAGALIATASTDIDNVPSQRVLAHAGFSEVSKDASLVFFERRLLD